MKYTLLLTLFVTLLTACSGGPTPPLPTLTPRPTSVPSSTPVPPTATPAPTHTPTPAATRQPTLTAEQPIQPEPTPSPQAAGNRNVELVSHVEGHSQAVSVAEDFAYLADDAGRLRILDVSDPAAPTQVGQYEMLGFPQALVVAGNYVYVADGNRYGLHVIDVSDPTAPIETSFLSTPGPAFDVAIGGQGTHAYLAEGYQSTNGELTGGGLRIIDVSDPTAPVELGFYDTPGQALSVAVAEPYAFVGDADAGLVVVDMSQPDNLTQAGIYRPRGPVSAIQVRQDFAYLVDGWGGSLRVVNVADRAAPVEAGFYYTFGLAQAVTLSDNRAFVANAAGELHVLDVSNPSAPTEAGFARIAGTVTDVAVSDNHVYVAAGDAGLFVLAFESPEQTPTPAPPTPAPLADTPPADLHRPEGTFADLWSTDEGLRQALGWALEAETDETLTAFQPFEGGVMIWREDERLIYALFRDGSWRAFDDTWTEDQPAFDPDIVAPPERFQPIRGFGKVWRNHRDVRGRLGWALQMERGSTSPVQTFERGVLISIADEIYGLVEVDGRPAIWNQYSRGEDSS